jgi:MoaA/NifB/PqqE/SkfB family radical SAM enzyme
MNKPRLPCKFPYSMIVFDLPSNRAKYCCKMHGGLNLDEEWDFKNNDFARKLRKKLWDGHRPKICELCWQAENKKVKSWRLSEGQWNDWEDPTPMYKTDTPNFRRIELMFDNTCDLACIYCGPWLSSSWVQEVKREQGKFKEAIKHFKPIQDVDRKVQNIIDTIEMMGEDSMPNVRYELAFLGGEPFLSPQVKNGKFERFIEAFYKHADPSRNLLLNFITNCNTPDAVWKKNYEILERSKEKYPGLSVHISMSLESVGKWTEMTRFNSSWKQVDKNIRRWLAIPWVDYNFNTAFNALSILNLKEYLQYLEKIHADTGRLIQLSPNVVYEPDGLQTSVLDKRFKKYIESAIDYFNKMDESIFAEYSRKDDLKAIIVNIKDTLGKNVTRQNIIDLKEYTDYMQKSRNIDLRDYNLDLYHYIYG